MRRINMSRKLRHNQALKQRGGSATEPVTAAVHRPNSSFLLGWLIALVVARWWLPTEGSAEGLTLWLVPLFCVPCLLAMPSLDHLGVAVRDPLPRLRTPVR